MSDAAADRADKAEPAEPADPVEGVDEADVERRRLAAALRPLITLTVASELDAGALAAAADEVEAMTARLSASAEGYLTRLLPDASRPPQEIFPGSPVMGVANPLAPPVRVTVVDGPEGGYPEIRGRVWFDVGYEGPPGCVHGGVIAETFDEMLGMANIVAGNPAMTGTLTIRYRRPTPLRTDLRIEARYLSRSGRKIRTWGGLYLGDTLTAEAEGIFVEVGPARMMALVEAGADTGGADAVAQVSQLLRADRPGVAPNSPT